MTTLVNYPWCKGWKDYFAYNSKMILKMIKLLWNLKLFEKMLLTRGLLLFIHLSYQLTRSSPLHLSLLDYHSPYISYLHLSKSGEKKKFKCFFISQVHKRFTFLTHPRLTKVSIVCPSNFTQTHIHKVIVWAWSLVYWILPFQLKRQNVVHKFLVSFRFVFVALTRKIHSSNLNFCVPSGQNKNRCQQFCK